MRAQTSFRTERNPYIREFEELHDVRLRPKKDSFWNWLVGLVVPGWNTLLYTTLRVPWERKPTIWYPEGAEITLLCYIEVHDLASRGTVLTHELTHADDQRTLAGLVWTVLCQVFPLPVFFSGRWFVERYAFLGDIRRGRHTVESAVYTLHKHYGRPWPRQWMREWFEARAGRQ